MTKISKTMNRPLPTVDILGTPFCVDVAREELHEKTRSDNRIPFEVFEQHGDGYTFLYDTVTHTAPLDKEEITEAGDRYRWVTLPALMELDPEGIALKYEIPLSVLQPALKQSDEPEEEDEDGEEFFR